MSTNPNSPLDDQFSIPQWLESLGLGEYIPSFQANQVSPDILLSLSDSDLEKCGVASFGHRKKILLAIDQLRGESGHPSSASLSPTPPSNASSAALPLAEPALVAAPAPEPQTAPISSEANFSQAGAAPGPRPAFLKPGPAPTNPERAKQGDAEGAPAEPRRSLWDRFGGRFLYISIIAHVLFGLIATWFVVQRIEAKRKLTFQSGSQGPSQSARAIEHKVQMTKKKNSMSAPPAQSKRITTTALSARIAIPAIQMPMTSEVTPSRMAGAGIAGLSLGTAAMSGPAGGEGGKGGGSMPFFGLPNSGVGLKGSFYDLKQTKGHQPTGIRDIGSFVAELNRFVTTGWRDSFFSKYFKAHKQLYATQIFVPNIASVTAPREFGVEKEVNPSFWMALYKGKISPPESGTYYFVGGGDNILIVRLNGKVVLDRSWDYKELFGMDKDWTPEANYDYKFGNIPNGFAKGKPMQLSAGEFYDIEILIGDDGGSAHFSLLVEKQGAVYQKTSSGLPILPVLRLSQDKEPPGAHPPFQPNGPVWKSRGESNPLSIFSH